MLDLEGIKKLIKENVPVDKVEEVKLEGPKVALYTKDPLYFLEDIQRVKELARLVKKKIIVRPSLSVLMPPEEAEEAIRSLIPPEAGVSSITFDHCFREVLIEAERLGLAIGRGASVLHEIVRRTKWLPRLLRKPPIEAEVVRGIRRILFDDLEERKQILHRIGKRIYRKAVSGCDWIRVTFLGGAREVGRSCYLLQTPESNVLLDCGINVAASDGRFPDLRAARLEIGMLDAVIISHAHLDHCGFLPYLYRYGFDGPVYCTEPTRDLMGLLLMDAVEVGLREDKELPYSVKDIKHMLRHTVTLNYEEVADITPDTKLTFYNAGHILGSAVVHLHIGEGLHNVIYTGDLKFGATRLLEPAAFEFPRIETLVIESTYGGKQDIQPNRAEAEQSLISVISRTVEQGGKVLIPVFAVGRSQEVMMVLESHYSELGEVSIYLDGMIWEATAIHTIHPEFLRKSLKRTIFDGYNPFAAEIFEKVDAKRRGEVIESQESCVILATSGMMTGGPSVEYFKHLAPGEKNLLTFVGYQAEGTLGRRLQAGLRELPIEEEGKRKLLKVEMRVETIDGFSGHADRRQLLGYVKRIAPKPKRVVLVHGEEKKTLSLSRAFQRIFDLETVSPHNLDTVRLL